MHDHLREEMTCENLLECRHGLKALDSSVVEHDGQLTVDEVAGGMQRLLNHWYVGMSQLIGQYHETDDGVSTPATTVEH